MLKSEIHRGRLTGAEVEYEGSITMDRTLLEAADVLPGEQAHVLNMANGSRLVTCIIEAPTGPGTIMRNGPAARLGREGDEVVIPTYCEVEEQEARQFNHRVVFVDQNNRARHPPKVPS